jgi:branched-chain amino acid transport system permease protein
MDINFFFEVLIGGLLSGVMYALVAIGFVLIYKASGCSTLPRAPWCSSRR